MGGDRPLQDRMNYRSGQVAKDRQELRDAAAGKPKKVSYQIHDKFIVGHK